MANRVHIFGATGSGTTILACPLLRLDSTHSSVPALCEQLLRALDHSIMA
ncbi:hypothetical protein [Pseudomonas sp. Au-Pse12]|nr:hypothetical protein [Pseudomonas sp. Au-Pse12]MCE4054251.1 hypothetical protein [Pseudomonas sp. Au-Pse12]